MKNQLYQSSLFRLHLVVFLWGFTAILGKLIETEATALVFYRMIFAAGFLYIYIRFIKKRSIHISRKLLLQLFGIGTLMAIHWLCFFYAIKVSNVSIALSCLAASTLFASFIEPIIYRRKVDLSEVIIGVIIVVCIAVIFQAELDYKVGIFVGILSAFFGTLFSVFNGKMFGKTSSGNIIFYEIFGGWFMISLFFLATGSIFSFHEISFKDLALLLILASVFTAFPMFESINLMKYISPFTLILTVNLEPVYGIFFAYFIFGDSEHMSPIFYLASLVMILAIVANGIIKAKKKKREIAIQ